MRLTFEICRNTLLCLALAALGVAAAWWYCESVRF
jgi:hypothetical protein